MKIDRLQIHMLKGKKYKHLFGMIQINILFNVVHVW